MGSVVKGITGGGGKDSAKAATSASQAASKGQIAAANTASKSQLEAAQAASQNSLLAAQQASNAYLQGSQTSGAYQQQALDYLKQADRLPTGLREQALKNLGKNYGLTIGPNGSVISDGSSIMDRAQGSPFYQNAVRVGENAVLRNASATGGLRSGSASENLSQVNQNALLSAYQDQLSGLQGLSSLPSNANNIAGLTSGLGNILGQGQTASGNALAQGQLGAGNYLYQGATNAANTLYSGSVDAGNTAAQGAIAAANASSQGGQNSFNNLLGLGGLAMQGFSAFSDRRLKSNIREIGKQNGHTIYSWRWNEDAKKLGMSGESFGVLADEIEQTRPDAVSMRDGYKVVDYQKLGVNHGF